MAKDKLFGGRQCLGCCGFLDSEFREIEGSAGSSQPRGRKISDCGRCETAVLQQHFRDSHDDKEKKKGVDVKIDRLLKNLKDRKKKKEKKKR